MDVTRSRRTDQVVLVAVILVAAFWWQWPFWAAGVLALDTYAVLWALARTLPGRREAAEPADLRLVRLRQRE